MAWTDSYGRAARKLRVSITDRCNLRCVYCMPASPVWLPKDGILSYEELARIVAAAAAHGVNSVRVTGGEPLVRQDAARFVGMVKNIPGIREVALTTNGVLLAEQAAQLRAAGLDRVTVSLDSLDAARYSALARRDGLGDTLAGIEAAERAGLPVKINAVVMRGVNDGEVGALAAWARETGREIRFIEFMPLEGDRIWNRNVLVSADEILAKISARFPIRAIARPGGQTAEEFEYLDGVGRVAVIASVTRAFCGDCDRIRVSAVGGFHTCLFDESGPDLRAALRSGATDEELARLMGLAVAAKGPGHLIDSPQFKRPERAMNAIGG